MDLAGFEHDLYIDPWQEYKTISAKLKKRFLRKPNVSEASRNFQRLARRLEVDNTCHYAGICKLAVARCEHSTGNVAGETGGLTEAGRLFSLAEQNRKSLGLSSQEENLTFAIHCYGHAIRVHLEHNQFELAAGLCLELGEACYSFGKTSEAIDYFQQAVNHFKEYPMCKLYAYKWLILCRIELQDYRSTLNLLDELVDFTLRVTNHNPIGPFRDIMRDSDILTLLSALRLDCNAGSYSGNNSSANLSDGCVGLKLLRLPEKQTLVLHQFLTVPTASPSSSSLDPGAAKPKDLASQARLHPYIDEDTYLCLQSFALALVEYDYRLADLMLKELWPALKLCQQDLALDLVERCSVSGGSGSAVASFPSSNGLPTAVPSADPTTAYL